MPLHIKITQRMVDAALNVAWDEAEKEKGESLNPEPEAIKRFSEVIEKMLHAAGEQMLEDLQHGEA